jgi:hypothetical protein
MIRKRKKDDSSYTHEALEEEQEVGLEEYDKDLSLNI